jgi:FixJ family two-component response regulator
MVASGYTDQILEGTKSLINGFIKKPFDSTQLLESVRRVLDVNNRTSLK